MNSGTKAVTAALLAMAVAGVAPADAKPWTIKIGFAPPPGHMQPIIEKLEKVHPELFHHLGKTYVDQGIHFRGSTPQIQALAIGDLQIAAFGPEALALSVNNAHLDTRMVADVFQDGVPGYRSLTYVVRADSPIKTVEELKGKRIATNAIGSAADTAMRAMLETVGLHDRRDYVVVQAAFQSMPALLREGKVDCAPILQPMLVQMEKTGKFRALFKGRDVMGATETVFLAGYGKFLDGNQAAMMDFMEDYVRSRQWFMNPQNRTAAIGIIADFMKVSPSLLSYLFTRHDYYRAPDGQPNIPGVQRPIDLAVKLGVLKRDVQIAPKYVDLRFVDEADKRIGKPPAGEATE